MKRKQGMKKIIIIALVMMTVQGLKSQSPLEQAKSELYNVNKVFDSSLYLGFDVAITYTSDTIYGKFAFEQMFGNYIMNDRQIYYKMGTTEYIQNDSFVYNIYHDEKMMMMTKNHVMVNSKLFPLRDFVDSILTWYDTAYNITLTPMDSGQVKELSFIAKLDSLPYRKFAIRYDSASYRPSRFEMEFFDGGDESDTVFLVSDSIQKLPFLTKPVKRRIVMEFTHYYNPTTLNVFDNVNYIYYNRQTKRFRPAEKLRAYRLIINGVEGESEPDDTVEIWPPPQQ
jgi:hypothetical protein